MERKDESINGALQRIEQKFELSEQEKENLRQIENSNITSVAYTADGGFMFPTGTYYRDANEPNYKIRIKYWEDDIGTEGVLLLKRNT